MPGIRYKLTRRDRTLGSLVLARKRANESTHATTTVVAGRISASRPCWLLMQGVVQGQVFCYGIVLNLEE